MKPKRWIILSSIAIVAVGAGVAAGMLLQQGSPANAASTEPVSYLAATQGHDPYPLVEAGEDGTVQWPLSTFDDYQAHYFTYVSDGESIEFFVLKSEDGIIRSAFNACDVCYRSLGGYSQNGQIMVCNNCGSQFPADQINVVRGGCNPSPLDRRIEGENLVIDAAAIVLGADYF